MLALVLFNWHSSNNISSLNALLLTTTIIH